MFGIALRKLHTCLEPSECNTFKLFLRTIDVVGQNFNGIEKAILQMCAYSIAISFDA